MKCHKSMKRTRRGTLKQFRRVRSRRHFDVVNQQTKNRPRHHRLVKSYNLLTSLIQLEKNGNFICFESYT